MTTKVLGRTERRRSRTVLMAILLVAGLGAAGLWRAWSWLDPGPVALGVAAYDRGRWDEAAELAQRRLAVAKDDRGALRLLARASIRLGRIPVARSIYNRLDASDLDAEDYCVLGLARNVSGEPVEAQKVLGEALRVAPDHAESLYLLGMATFQRGWMLESARAAERLAKRPGWEARADLLLGMIGAGDNDPAGASQALRRALERDPGIRLVPADPSGTQKLLARVLLRAGRWAEARDTLGAILKAGSDPEASWLMSRAAMLEGDWARAADALTRSGTYRAEHPLEPEPAAFVGEARCAGCHPKAQHAVQASRHARTFRSGRALDDLPLPDRPLADPDNPQVTHTFHRGDGQVRVETRVSVEVLRAVVDYALGSTDRYTSLIARDQQGQVRTLRLSYHRGAKGSGWDRSKGQAVHPHRLDEFLGERFASDDEWVECLVCHTTSARAARLHVGPESADRAIGCERCHGPGGLHVAAVAARFSDMAIANPAQARAAEVNQSCGGCHGQHSLPMPASRTAPDWTRFPGSTLPWSRCYVERGGALSCVTCHDPHRDAETSPAYYEAKCLACHASPSRTTASTAAQPQQAEATRRSSCPINPSRDCLGCHMPKVEYDWLHGFFTDHYIRVHRSPGP
ncbi:MAG: tetratricopeptide repeat protein [Isosphaeraceae bacterium]